ncbi:19581_t:CDS:2 [Cetraspora pellucida]|uniref:19581_t:CDS:1 n=1 Tax=Cetraspora pellucida TaxID=1433469 RepID=A0A9N9EXF8_9GLOM|nr:19581_t:CDS:2 [Cetraspora pellucida]
MDKETLKLFTRELTSLYNSNHPNIIKLYGVSINPESKQFSLILQIADSTLRDHLKSKRNEGTPSGYIDLFSRCWSSAPEDRPELDIILSQLERLSTEPIKVITNRIVMRDKIDVNQDDSIDNSSANEI